MKTTYVKDNDSLKIFVTREFNDDLPTVWRAWTDAALLDQWWAPKPWKTETKSMDFSEGGMWLYVMKGPAGEQYWSKLLYREIDIPRKIDAMDAFCDEKGEVAADMLTTEWEILFELASESTLVSVEISFDNAESMNKLIEMGFEEGFARAHENLDELLKTL